MIHMKATEQYFPVVRFIILYKIVLTFESADELNILKVWLFPVLLFTSMHKEILTLSLWLKS